MKTLKEECKSCNFTNEIDLTQVDDNQDWVEYNCLCCGKPHQHSMIALQEKQKKVKNKE